MVQDNRKDPYKPLSFSNYKKTDLFSILERSIIERQLEAACHWTVEIHCSGWIDTFWEKILVFASRRISTKNPNLPEFMLNKYTNYYSRLLAYQNDRMATRNDPLVREILGQVVGVLCYSQKGTMDSLPKINEPDFILENISHRCLAYHAGYNKIGRFKKRDDPPELETIGNELLYQLESHNLQGVYYWISWIINWEKLYTKRVGEFRCSLRTTRIVDVKYHRDVVWFFWEILLSLASTVTIKKQVQALFKLYQVDFSRSKKTARWPLILHAFQYLTEHLDFSIPIMHDSNLLLQIGRNMTVLYGELVEQRQTLTTDPSLPVQPSHPLHPSHPHQTDPLSTRHPSQQSHPSSSAPSQQSHSSSPYSSHAMSPEINHELRDFYSQSTPTIQTTDNSSIRINDPRITMTQNQSGQNRHVPPQGQSQKKQGDKKKKKNELSEESQSKLQMVDKLFNQLV